MHELHIWRLNQYISVASAHLVVKGKGLDGWEEVARRVGECFHGYGVHSVTLMPEGEGEVEGREGEGVGEHNGGRYVEGRGRCRFGCESGSGCETLTCCG